ncbi:isocitrate/isopropylmalate family dehydrogenase [Streptomyces sp. NPDC057474]|uniref:isocitrate/isopropylmalate family dehydrogenase n=1 Tax=Streptomyces sp. NPDC057474 TaxID=3346144 RepID=UPI003685107C
MFEPVPVPPRTSRAQDLANPIGAVGSAALMLEHFGLPDRAARLHKAIEATTAAGSSPATSAARPRRRRSPRP